VLLTISDCNATVKFSAFFQRCGVRDRCSSTEAGTENGRDGKDAELHGDDDDGDEYVNWMVVIEFDEVAGFCHRGVRQSNI
jgi:hypothetical protein